MAVGIRQKRPWQRRQRYFRSILKISRQRLGHVLFSIDQDEGVPEVALEAHSSSVDPHIFSVDIVVRVLLLRITVVEIVIIRLAWELILICCLRLRCDLLLLARASLGLGISGGLGC